MFTELIVEPHLEAGLALDTERFRFRSSVEGPLVVDAVDWRTALCLGMQLLEREDAVGRLQLARRGDAVLAEDPWTHETFSVEPIFARGRARSAA